MKKIYTLTLLLNAVNFTFATTRDVPGTYATIQAGLNACAAGDTVLVQPGTYTQNLTWPAMNGIKLIAVGDTSNTIISGTGTATTLTISTVLADTNSLIKGFKITNGFFNSTFGYGGGIYISQGGAKFKSCLIANNNPGGNLTSYAYGAGAYIGGNNSLFVQCMFRNNASTSTGYAFGGAVYVKPGSTARFNNSVIRSNSITATNYCFGGGIYSEGNLIMLNSHVDYNMTSSGGYNSGGGIDQSGGTASLTNVTLIGNTIGGAANYFWGAGFFAGTGANTTMTNVLVSNNVLSAPGFIYAGGGIHVEGTNTLLTATNVTVSENHRSDNGTINGSGLEVETSGTAVMKNCILWNTNGGAEVTNSSGTITITYSDVRGGFVGTGNINSNALFVSTSDFHLTNSSPCLAAGTLTGAPNNDLDNATRPMPALTNPDMGAYELNQPLTAISGIENEFFALQTYPNPFSTTTAVHFSLTETSQIKVEVLDINGRLVETLLEGEYPKSEFVLKFDGSKLQAGMYFCKMTIGNEIRVVKMMKQ